MTSDSSTGPASIAEPNPSWPTTADHRIARLREVFSPLVEAGEFTIDHIGSTSVAGLAAKPIVDLQIRMPIIPRDPALSDALAPLGYRPAHGSRPDSPGVYRDIPRGTEDVPDAVWEKRLFFLADPALPSILHIRQTASPFGRYTVLFRDWLRANPEQRDAYAAEKRRLAAEHANDADYDDYTRAKTSFIDFAQPFFEQFGVAEPSPVLELVEGRQAQGPRRSKTAIVLRHDESIHLGNLEPVLREHGYELRFINPTSDDLGAVDPSEADLVVVLGGEMGVYETEEYPFLVGELALLRDRLNAERPTFGVCLGAQLMAGALGARVYPGASTQIGFRRVEPTAQGAASPTRHFANVPVVEWHGDTFDLPERATLLASSGDYANEAFAVGDFALAVQFHPEVTPEMHEDWLGRDHRTLERLALDADALRADRERYTAAMTEASRRLLTEWLDALP